MPFIFNSHRFSSPAVVTDTDVIAYMTATGIPNDGTVYYGGTLQQLTGAQIWQNVNDLIVGLKGDGTYAKLIALYPQVGDTEFSQKWNAIDPRDLDAAHRLTYHGTGGFVDQNGAHFTGANYINSHFAPTTITDGFFVGATQRNSKSGVIFGTVLGSGSICSVDFHNRTMYGGWVFPESFTTDKSQLTIVFDRPDSTQYNLYIDGVAHNKVEDLWLTPLGTNDFYFGCHNDANPTPTPVSFSDSTLSTMFAGLTMSALEHISFNGRMYAFNYAMKRTQRNVYFFGDSISDGSNSTVPYQLNRWTKQLSDALSFNEINYGISGRVLTETTPAPYPPSMVVNSTTIVPAKTVDDKYIFVAYGVNDARYLIDDGLTNYTTALFTTQLDTVIFNIISAGGWTWSDIVFVTGYKTNSTFTAQYANLVAATHAVATPYGCQVINVSGLTYTAGDNIHPDQDGHDEIAAYIATQLV